ncbi:hypothetical protein [Kitasatospora sp. NPDC097643]|uniref:hypothetical protein n=1 Tax=Kitasatospora sp. NPDC097643 TaxID=3157230 RepID=UPI003326C58F
MTLAIDVGTRFVRLALVGPDGHPALADLPGTVAGEGLPVPPGQDPAQVLVAACAAYRALHGHPARVVLVAPEAMPPGHLHRVVEAFGDPTPVRELRPAAAVLALLRRHGEAVEGTWAVCALGTTTVEVTVCVVAPRSVGIRRFVRHTPAGGLGAAFDTALLHGTRPGTGSPTPNGPHSGHQGGTPHSNAPRTGHRPGGAASGHFGSNTPPRHAPRTGHHPAAPAEGAGLEALRAARALPGAAERWEQAVARAERHPARYDDTPVLWLAGREVSAGTARRAVAALREQVGEAAAESGLDGLPVVAVGGPARLPAIRRAAAGAGRETALPAGTDPALAAVLGAALVAAGRVDPADRYPFEVLLGARYVRHGRLAASELTLCGPGRLVPGGATVFAERDGRRLAVGGAGGRPREAEVRVRDATGGPTVRVGAVALPASAAGERFHVGVAMAADGRTRLVLRPVGGHGEPHEYPLGELPGVLEGETR